MAKKKLTKKEYGPKLAAVINLRNGKPSPHALEAFALYDNKTDQYNIPSFYMNEFEARRTSENMFINPRFKDALPVTNSTDYSLFRVGYYDQATGILTPLPTPQHILNMHEIKAFVEKQQQAKSGPAL